MDNIAGSAHPEASAAATEDPLIALFREHSTKVRAQVGACRPSRKKNESLTGTLAQWLALHFTVTAHRMAQTAGEEGLSLDVLQKLTACVVALRKGDQAEQRMELERQRIEISGQLTEERMERRFDQWLDDPEIMERFRPEPKITPEEKERMMKAVFGLYDDAPPSPPPAASGGGRSGGKISTGGRCGACSERSQREPVESVKPETRNQKRKFP